MCEHERLRTVGDRVYCCACGVELPLAFLTAKSERPEEEKLKNKAAKKPAKGGSK